MNNFQLLNVLDATNFSTLLIILFQIKIAQNLIIDIHYSLMKNNPDLCTIDKFLLHFQKYFVDEKPVWSEEKGRVHVDKSIAQYTGGLVTIPKDLSDGLGVGMPELAHLVIGLESVSHQHKDFIPFCVSSPLYFHSFFTLNLYIKKKFSHFLQVLNMLMGGGGSFSAGGPGKGMYTRLYTNVLNQYHWMYSAAAYNHAYADSGVFCINSR